MGKRHRDAVYRQYGRSPGLGGQGNDLFRRSLRSARRIQWQLRQADKEVPIDPFAILHINEEAARRRRPASAAGGAVPGPGVAPGGASPPAAPADEPPEVPGKSAREARPGPD